MSKFRRRRRRRGRKRYKRINSVKMSRGGIRL